MADQAPEQTQEKKEDTKKEEEKKIIKNRHLHIGGDKKEVSSKVSQYILQCYNESIEKTGRFTIAFSGGSLPAIVADGIVDNKEFAGVDYSKWFVFFADERCVGLNHADSNYLSVKQKLLDKLKGIKDDNVFAIDEKLVNDPKKSALVYQERMEKVFTECKLPEFDLILLGMGEDGHTCSLFPGHPLSSYTGERWVESITDSPKLPPNRITLTFPVLFASKHVAFVATGGGKKDVLHAIFKENNKPNYPAGNVCNSSGEVDWFVDKDAASTISSL